MAEPARDIIVLGFRTTTYTKVVRGDRTADGLPGKVISTEENVPDYWVKYVNRNMPQSTATEDRLRFMDPDNLRVPDGAEGGEKLAFLKYRWEQIKPAFDAWMSGQQLPEYGIPIGAWPALNAEQVKGFLSVGVKSVEDVRDLTENQIGRIKLPNVRDLKKLAALYLDGLGSAQAAEAAAAQEARISGLEQQLEAALELLGKQAEETAVSQGGKKPAKAA